MITGSTKMLNSHCF